MKTKLLIIFALLLAGTSLSAQNVYNSYGVFSGNQSYVAIPYHFELRPASQMTIEAWVNPELQAAGIRTIYGNNPNVSSLPFLGLVGTENKPVFILNGTLTGRKSIPVNQWTHIAASYDGSVKRIYINGILDTLVSTAGLISADLDSTYIGASVPGNYFKGKIDDVRLWGRAKMGAEIQRDMYIPLTCLNPSGPYSHLIGVWRFDIGGATAFDEGGTIGNNAFYRNVTVTPYGNKVAVNYEANGSLVLSELKDYCAVPPNSRHDATTGLTIEAWVKRNTDAPNPPNTQYIVSKANLDLQFRYALILKKTGELGFIYSGGQFTIQPVVTTDQWTHVALTYNAANSTTVFYVNGDSVAGTFSSAGNLESGPSDSLFIGGLPFASVPVLGQLDEVRIWKNTVRTKQQIKENMHKNINYKTTPAPSPADFMVFSFDGRTDDTGNDALTNPASTLKFHWSAHMYAGKRNTYNLTSPILRDDQGDFMGASYNKGKRRFYLPDDGGVTSAYDSVFFSSPGTVSNLKMYIMLSTASSNHLEITLTAPNGTSVQLTPNAGNGGDAMGSNGSNDLMTIFDQSADTTITYAYNNMLAPYSPKIKPYQSLAVFNGISRQGWWKIKITDKYNWDQAFLHGWGIQTSILTSTDPVTQTPYEYSLKQNYPNPFNPSTTINYELKNANNVKLNVYDITGKRVSTLVNNIQEAGKHTVTFNASHLSSGVYFYKLETEDFTDTKRMLLIK